jgi:hypothetical protein
MQNFIIRVAVQMEKKSIKANTRGKKKNRAKNGMIL